MPHPRRPPRPHKTPERLLSLVLPVLSFSIDHGPGRNSQSDPTSHSRSEGPADPAAHHPPKDVGHRRKNTATSGLHCLESCPRAATRSDVSVDFSASSAISDTDANGDRQPAGQRRRNNRIALITDVPRTAEGSCPTNEGCPAKGSYPAEGSCRYSEDSCLTSNEGPYSEGSGPKIACKGCSSAKCHSFPRRKIALPVPAHRPDSPADTTVPGSINPDGRTTEEREVPTSSHRTCSEGSTDSRANPDKATMTSRPGHQKREVEGHDDHSTTSPQGHQRHRPTTQEVKTNTNRLRKIATARNKYVMYLVVKNFNPVFYNFRALKLLRIYLGGIVTPVTRHLCFPCLVHLLTARSRHLRSFYWRVCLNTDADDVTHIASRYAFFRPDGATVRLVHSLCISRLLPFLGHAYSTILYKRVCCPLPSAKPAVLTTLPLHCYGPQDHTHTNTVYLHINP